MCKVAQSFTNIKTTLGESGRRIAFTELHLNSRHLENPFISLRLCTPTCKKLRALLRGVLPGFKWEARSIKQSGLHQELAESNLVHSKQASPASSLRFQLKCGLLDRASSGCLLCRVPHLLHPSLYFNYPHDSSPNLIHSFHLP